MKQLVLIRHGESQWNRENRFTGWQDVELSDTGLKEASQAGVAIQQAGLVFDFGYTSFLKRAQMTLELALKSANQTSLPILKTWRLNERHYGSLTGLNKSETAALHGEDQVKIWRRSYDVPPPMMELSDERHPSKNAAYKDLPAEDQALLSRPFGESLKDTVARFLPLWNGQIKKDLMDNKKILIVAHGNSLRALIQVLEGMTPDQIMEVNLPTGIPLLYTLTDDLKVVSKKYLGDPEVVRLAIEKVAGQGKAAPKA